MRSPDIIGILHKGKSDVRRKNVKLIQGILYWLMGQSESSRVSPEIDQLLKHYSLYVGEYYKQVIDVDSAVVEKVRQPSAPPPHRYDCSCTSLADCHTLLSILRQPGLVSEQF